MREEPSVQGSVGGNVEGGQGDGHRTTGEGPGAKASTVGERTSAKLGCIGDAAAEAIILSRAEIHVPISSIAAMTAVCLLMRESVVVSSSSRTCCVVPALIAESNLEWKSVKEPSRTEAMVGRRDSVTIVGRDGMRALPTTLVRMARSVASKWFVTCSGTLAKVFLRYFIRSKELLSFPCISVMAWVWFPAIVARFSLAFSTYSQEKRTRWTPPQDK
jgi:hypothetical protein